MPSVRGAPTGPHAMATACPIGNRRRPRLGTALAPVRDTALVRAMVLAPVRDMALARDPVAVVVEIIMKPVL